MIAKRYTAKDDQFFRLMVFPEEERHKYTSQPWDGSFRWFRADNILCLEHYRKVADGHSKEQQAGAA